MIQIWLWIAAVVLVGLTGLAMLIGLMLPQGHVVSRAATYSVPPEDVWSAITGYEDQPAWRSGLERVERVAGRDHTWQEVPITGRPLTLATVHCEAPRRLVRRIVDPELPFGGSWMFTLEQGGAGTTVRITEKGEIYSPVVRFVARIFRDPARTVETYLRDLGRRFGEEAEVRPVG